MGSWFWDMTRDGGGIEASALDMGELISGSTSVVGVRSSCEGREDRISAALDEIHVSNGIERTWKSRTILQTDRDIARSI